MSETAQRSGLNRARRGGNRDSANTHSSTKDSAGLKKSFERTTFATSRLLEFFSEKELQMQLGDTKPRWALALLKELLDNSLDACESAGVAPDITVIVEPDALTVIDNGAGIPQRTIERSLDYSVRVSDKSYYASPSRGQLGNALKCLYPAAFVFTNATSTVVIETGGQRSIITVGVDRIAQVPDITLTTEPCDVKNGTSITLAWPSVASLLKRDGWFVSSTETIGDAWDLFKAFACFNPHARITLEMLGTELIIEPTTSDWRKWLPSDPTSPHWYTPERFADLVAAYLTVERNGGPKKSLREFIGEFRGLTSTAKQKRVTDETGLTGTMLRALAPGDELDQVTIARLHTALCAHTKPVKSKALGTLGKEHVHRHLAEYWHVDPESVRYKRIQREHDHRPSIIEVGFGIFEDPYTGCGRHILTGLNWSANLSISIPELRSLLGKQRIDAHGPVVVVVHLAMPTIPYTDRGKSVVALTRAADEEASHAR